LQILRFYIFVLWNWRCSFKRN